jgi:transposase InsO family protein
VKDLHEQGYPVALGCDVVELPRSSYYYQAGASRDATVIPAMKAIAGEYPTYGIRHMTQQLRRPPHALVLNHKRVARLMGQAGLLQPRRKRKCRTTNSDHPYPRYPNLVKTLVVGAPEQVWVSDITYIRLGHGFVYLAIILDVFTRAVRGWALSKTIDGEITLSALRLALAQRCPTIHHSDQGVQYAASAYTAMLQQHNIQISMAAVGKAEENGYAERFMRTIKEEEVDLSEYRDFSDAHRQLGRFIDQVYNTKRIHSSLGYLTPSEFEADYWKNAPTRAQAPLSTP